jgi:hypothetical protein
MGYIKKEVKTYSQKAKKLFRLGNSFTYFRNLTINFLTGHLPQPHNHDLVVRVEDLPYLNLR